MSLIESKPKPTRQRSSTSTIESENECSDDNEQIEVESRKEAFTLLELLSLEPKWLS
jgi:hypothetical protein